MDVDDARRAHARTQRAGEDLHVAGEHDEVDVVRFDELEDRLLLRLFRRRGHGQVVERDAVAGGERFCVAVVADDDGDFDGQLAAALAEEKVCQTVQLLAYEDQHFGLLRNGTELQVHAHVGGQLVEARAQGRRVEIARQALPEVDAHEEGRGRWVGCLLGFEDVEGGGSQETGDGVDYAWTVGAGEGQDVVGWGAGGVGDS